MVRKVRRRRPTARMVMIASTEKKPTATRCMKSSRTQCTPIPEVCSQPRKARSYEDASTSVLVQQALRLDTNLEEPAYLEIELAVGAIAYAASHDDWAQEGLHQDGRADIVG